MPQINELTTRTFDGDSLIGFDVENTDPQTQAQYPYVTGKADGNALADFIANEQEYVTDLNTVDKHINGAINELHAINGYSYDAYDDTATYAVGDLCIYNNALYKCTTAITTAEAWNASHWTATSIADEISRIDDDKQDNLIFHSSNSPSAISVNGTYQIPQNVLDHTFIIVGARRAGRGGSVIFSKENLITFDNAFTVMADNNTGYTLKCSSTGLITLVSINGGLSEPYILVNGLL